MSFRSLLLLLTFAFSAEVLATSEMHTRIFKLPPDFFSYEIPAKDAAPVDPFAAPATTPAENAPPPKPKTARQILEAQGITFREGASVTFTDPVNGVITITNTQPNLDLVEAYVETLHKQAPATVAYTVTVIEGPGELIREANALASRSANAAPALNMLLDHAKKPGSAVRVVGDAFVETKSGTRATTEAVREHSYITDFTLDAKSRASITKEMLPIGLYLEIDTTVGADGATIETTLSLTLNAAPPTKRQVSVNDPLTGHAAEFPVTDIPRTQFVTGVSITAGSTKLIGITKPVGTSQESADILCAAFLTASLRRVEALPAPQPKVAGPAAVPSGMMFAALHAPDGLFDGVLQYPKPITLKAWLEQAGVTFPSGSLIEHRDGVLRCVNTPDNIALIAVLVDHQLNVFAKTVAFTLHTLEGPAPFLRDLTRQTLAAADDSAMFAAVEAAVARGEARFIESAFIETKSGTHARHEAVCEHRYFDGFSTNAQGRPELSFETRPVGTVLEVDPTIGADSRTVELTFSHELHTTLPIMRREHFRDPASQQPFDIPVTDFNTHKITAGISVAKGGTKLIALNEPTGRDKPGMLWATFLKCDVVPQICPPKYTIKVSQTAVKPVSSEDSTEMYVRQYRFPPDFLSDRSVDKSQPRNAAALPSRKTMDIVLKEFFEQHGVSFQKGSGVWPSNADSAIYMRNTTTNLDLAETVVTEFLADSAKTIAFTAHVLQGPGPLLRRLTTQAASKSNHRAELDELLAAVKTGVVRSLGTSRIETKSGQSATVQQGAEHTALDDVRITKEGAPEILTATRSIGLKLELEPILGADGQTVDLSLAPEFHTAAPFEHREHIIDPQGRRLEFPLTDYHVAKVVTGITIPDGTARLLSLHKPTGKPEFENADILQAIFVTCDVVRAVE